MKKKWIGGVVAAGISLMITGALLVLWRIWEITAIADRILTVCNAFFVPAVLMLGFGLMDLILSAGTLDMLGYGFHSLTRLFTPIDRKENKGGFYEYKMKKEEKRSGNPKPWYVFIVGGADLLVTVILRAFWGG